MVTNWRWLRAPRVGADLFLPVVDSDSLSRICAGHPTRRSVLASAKIPTWLNAVSHRRPHRERVLAQEKQREKQQGLGRSIMFLNFVPLPHGQGSFRPGFISNEGKARRPPGTTPLLGSALRDRLPESKMPKARERAGKAGGHFRRFRLIRFATALIARWPRPEFPRSCVRS